MLMYDSRNLCSNPYLPALEKRLEFASLKISWEQQYIQRKFIFVVPVEVVSFCVRVTSVGTQI